MCEVKKAKVVGFSKKKYSTMKKHKSVEDVQENFEKISLQQSRSHPFMIWFKPGSIM